MTRHISLPKKPQLSIITVVKNNPKGLAQTVASISESMYAPLCEHIIIDASEQEVMHSYAQSLTQRHIVHIPSQDKSIYDGMNKGIIRARGSWLWFVNSGDTVLASASLMHYLKNNETPKMPLIFAPVLEDWNGQKITRSLRSFSDFPLEMPTSHQGMLFWAPLHKLFLYDTSYKVCADLDLLVKLNLNADMVTKVPEPIACTDADGFSTLHWLPMLKEKKLIFSLYSFGFFLKLRYCYFFLTIIIKKVARYMLPDTMIKYLRTKKYK